MSANAGGKRMALTLLESNGFTMKKRGRTYVLVFDDGALEVGTGRTIARCLLASMQSETGVSLLRSYPELARALMLAGVLAEDAEWCGEAIQYLVSLEETAGLDEEVLEQPSREASRRPRPTPAPAASSSEGTVINLDQRRRRPKPEAEA